MTAALLIIGILGEIYFGDTTFQLLKKESKGIIVISKNYKIRKLGVEFTMITNSGS